MLVCSTDRKLNLPSPPQVNLPSAPKPHSSGEELDLIVAKSATLALVLQGFEKGDPPLDPNVGFSLFVIGSASLVFSQPVWMQTRELSNVH